MKLLKDLGEIENFILKVYIVERWKFFFVREKKK